MGVWLATTLKWLSSTLKGLIAALASLLFMAPLFFLVWQAFWWLRWGMFPDASLATVLNWMDPALVPSILSVNWVGLRWVLDQMLQLWVGFYIWLATFLALWPIAEWLRSD